MLRAQYAPYTLDFKFPARTSREVMTRKQTYFVKVWEESEPERFGIGECALFKGLSCDDVPSYDDVLFRACKNINELNQDDLRDYPSILFGFETALLDLRNGAVRRPFLSPWSNGDLETRINGLVWMGTVREMQLRIEEKLKQGFKCLKFKIGGEDFEQEYALLENVRKRYSPDILEIRLDANGAFTSDNALDKINRLSRLQIHSLEQPVMAGQEIAMARICRESPIPIALDEELIGHNDAADKLRLLSEIKPQYIILKPALCGGFSGAMEWISISRLLSIGWWVTSALESNVGLNAIAQWISTMDTTMPQGLGTGALYANNIKSPIVQERDIIKCDPAQKWEIPHLKWI